MSKNSCSRLKKVKTFWIKYKTDALTFIRFHFSHLILLLTLLSFISVKFQIYSIKAFLFILLKKILKKIWKIFFNH